MLLAPFIGFVRVAIAAAREPKKVADIPPGWVPVNVLDEKPAWADFRKIEDKIHLDFPKDAKSVRGVFDCCVLHSQDPRELADVELRCLNRRCR